MLFIIDMGRSIYAWFALALVAFVLYMLWGQVAPLTFFVYTGLTVLAMTAALYWLHRMTQEAERRESEHRAVQDALRDCQQQE